ncbi:hypothetical protein Dsin_021246 [Dipteronia sinensis]|uniref:Uncharacterized protein n=1 Tax=Dipteronia sinensis TaxID=43782 RepID=A0AAE0DYT7_9ROSI|nr:hypothetical protein Dsin_021246 [Dipteronia sinensis]
MGGEYNPNSSFTMMASSTAPPWSTPSLVTTTAPPSIFTFQPSPSPVSTTTFNIPAFGEYDRSSFGAAARRLDDPLGAPFTFTNPPNSTCATFSNPFTTQPATTNASIQPSSSSSTYSFSKMPAPPTTTFTFPIIVSPSMPVPTPPLFQHFARGELAPPTNATMHVCKRCGEKSFWGEQWGSRVAPYIPTLCPDSNPGLQGKPQGQVAPPPTNEFATFGGVKPQFALPVFILPVMPSSSSGAFNIIP